MDSQEINIKFIRRYMSLPAALAVLENSSLALGPYSHWEDASERASLEAYERSKGMKRGSLRVLCFTLAPETHHHWNTYAKEGVCFVFRKDKMDAQLDASQLRRGPVRYIEINELEKEGDSSNWPFLKRWPFRDELEYRVLGCEGDTILVDASMVERIYLSPWIDTRATDALKRVFSKLGGDKVEVYKTTLLDNARWVKYFGNRKRSDV